MFGRSYRSFRRTWRGRLNVAAGLLAVCMSSGTAGRAAEASAETHPPSDAAITNADATLVSVGAGDSLEIRVYGDASSSVLSGRYTVNQDGRIDFPLLGDVTAAGRTTDEIGKAIASGLETGVSVLTVVTVTIAEYAPVYVVGKVNRPGPVPFRPQMNVMELILQSGGLPQADQSTVDAAVQEVTELQILEFYAAVQLARLTAEARGEDFNGSRFLQEPAPYKATIVANEVAVLEAHRRAESALLRAYEAQRDRAAQEVASLRDSIRIQDEEVAMVEQELGGQAKLADRGFATQSRVNEIKRDFSQSRLRALDLRTELFRAEQALLLADQNIREVDIKSDTQALETVAQLEVERSRNASKLELAKRLLLSLQSTANVSQEALGRNAQYTIFRLVSGSYQEGIAAEELTELRRGDIVRVEYSGAAEAGGADQVQPNVMLAR
jgi:polysaccharide biosynthesis/export protein